MLSSQHHLHRECNVIPVREHSTLLTKQHTTSCYPNNSPVHRLLDLPPQQRQLNLIHLKHLPEVSYPPNRVLQRKPPDINKEENLLPRPARSELARLRSDFSRNLNSYMSRIDPSIQDTCPSCNHIPHDTNHLFNCGSRPTDLEPSALCTHPK